MANSDPKSCNRRPFVSDDECSRGDVDTRQFSDFPYCDTFSPSLPDIPPEITDTPLNITIPPPCSCFNMKYSMGMKYTKGGFKASANFRADGDCCDGNYVSTFDLQIPCPIKSQGLKKIRASVKYGKNEKLREVTYISADAGACKIDIYEPSINLELHCPITGINGAKKINIGLKYGSRNPEGSFSESYMSTDVDKCALLPKDVKFNLELKCPIPRQEEYHKSKFYVKWGSSRLYTVVGNMSFDHSKCELRTNSSSYELEIKCPIRGEGNKKISISTKFKKRLYPLGETDAAEYLQNKYLNRNKEHFNLVPYDIWLTGTAEGRAAYLYTKGEEYRENGRLSATGSKVEIPYAEVSHGACEISLMEPKINLEIPCPIKKKKENGGPDPKLRVKMKWRRYFASSRQSVSFLSWDSSSCVISMRDASYSFMLNCPISTQKWNETKKLKFMPIAYKKMPESTSVGYLNAGRESHCSFSIPNEDNPDLKYQLQIKCPIKGFDQDHKRKMKMSIKYKKTIDPHDNSFSFLRGSSSSGCNIDIVRTDFEIKAPCRDIFFRKKIGKGYVYTTNMNYVGIDMSSSTLEDCTKNFYPKLVLPAFTPITIGGIVAKSIVFKGCDDGCNNIRVMVEGSGPSEDGIWDKAIVRMCFKLS